MKPRKAPAPTQRLRSPPRPMTLRLSSLLWIIVLCALVGLAAVGFDHVREEMRTSRLQAKWLTEFDSHIRFTMQPGPAPDMYYPIDGPYNRRLGYSYLPFYFKSLESESMTVAAQMRSSNAYHYLVDRGIYPIYHPKTLAGLSILDRDDKPLYSASYPTRVFNDFDAIPTLLVDTLLYIENRELLRDGPYTRNPVIEWDRFIYAIFGHALHSLVPTLHVGGSSTLATQIEKFRFSPNGQTPSGMEKIRQIISASLRVYMDGPDTRPNRRNIVRDYLNSTPLGARPGFGEVNSIGDGLWAWYGLELNDVSEALSLPEDSPEAMHVKAHAFRAALNLILAQRRPTYYLQSNREALDDLADATLGRLADAQIISTKLRDYALAASVPIIREAPPPPQTTFLEQKAVTSLRTHLLDLLGLSKFYELDRLDIEAKSTLDSDAEKQLVAFLKKMGDRDFLKSIGLYGFRLLNPDNDPTKIKWSVVLYERTPEGNKLRLQGDNIDEPFDMNEGVKLDLGSTAKLRTLITYLEIIGELHRRYAGLEKEDLTDMVEDAPDNLTEWAITWLASKPHATIQEMLDAAMERKYSGSTAEVFFTGGGAHTFGNFEKKEDYENFDLHGGFRESVNLVFIRVMRDIVNYTIAQGPHNKDELLDDPEAPARQDYLARFAEEEGSIFLNRYIATYGTLSPDEALSKILAAGRKSAVARTTIYRSLRPLASFETYRAFMLAGRKDSEDVSEAKLRKLYHDYAMDKFSLSDRAYIARVNPMELWLVSYLAQHPKASHHDILLASRQTRLESYAWLFRPSKKHAQDTRIRIVLEEEAFAHIQKRWERLGYPFKRLVPSYATAIGSSADRPGALAELVGIILNDGVRKPTIRFESLEFGKDTPFDTIVKPRAHATGQTVLDPAIAKTVKSVMAEVVENGTAKRVNGVYKDAAGKPLPVGGKTGTGDHRFDEFGPGGQLIESRVVNRTGTFVFYLGDHFFGTVTAHVAGSDAADYTFTSALSAQMLKSLAVIFQPLITPDLPIY